MKTPDTQPGQMEWTAADKAGAWGFLAVGVLALGLAYNASKDYKRQYELRRHLPKFPIERVDNKCEGTIMTIGDLKLRMPKPDLPQQVVFPQAQTPPQK
jgi:hypothetical protein